MHYLDTSSVGCKHFQSNTGKLRKMKDSSRTAAIKILILPLIVSLLSQRTTALDCISVTGFNLQCPSLSNSVCLSVGAMSNATTPYDLLCDRNDDCELGADEGHSELSPSLDCSKCN